jgi:hypothetical protein
MQEQRDAELLSNFHTLKVIDQLIIIDFVKATAVETGALRPALRVVVSNGILRFSDLNGTS